LLLPILTQRRLGMTHVKLTVWFSTKQDRLLQTHP
jgi:hypothetical protein